MFAAFLTTILFSLSVIFASRTVKLIGGTRANLSRVVLATAFLAIWAHGFGAGLRGSAFRWFFLSGCVGFGLGDLALFASLSRIGPRLAILLTQCLAAPLAALAEWIWLGTTLTFAQVWCAVVILLGVGLALAPDHGMEVGRRAFWIGVIAGVGSALGQGLGAVISRKANAIANFPIDGLSAAYQRILGGLLVTAIAFFLLRKQEGESPEPRWREAVPWTIANALAGPAIGVGCFQWALATTPSGVVLPIVATSPVMTIILARFIDGTRPTRRALIGGIIAVAGAIALKLAQT